jgi:solute:Na+ symporter, SSS family
VIAVGTAIIASGYSNLMDYLQTLFGFFNAPLFATFILGMFWKRMTATAGWAGLVSGTLAAVLVAVLSEDSLGAASVGVLPLSGQGASFVAAGAAFVVDIVVSVAVSMATAPKPVAQLAGLVYSETPREQRTDPDAHRLPWYRSPTKLAGISLVMVIILNVIFR